MTGVDFASLGHQDSWTRISRMVHALRDPQREPLSIDALREVVPWIPPRTVARVTVRSFPSGQMVQGVYIETFITPDELQERSFRRNLEKVLDGIRAAQREGARVVSLGGFTSIVLEGRLNAIPGCESLALTTGNTLTAAYILKGVQEASRILNIPLDRASVLVIGATGDVGSACASYLAGRVRKLLLVARNVDRLRRQQEMLRRDTFVTEIATEAGVLLPHADVVISAASLAAPTLRALACRPDVLVCDAGYPKNLVQELGEGSNRHLFWGGMGRVLGGWRGESELLDAFYNFPAPFIGHGCLLEGILLALEKRYEPFSYGRGNITPQRIEEIWSIAQRHGFVLAPFFDADGLWQEQHPWAVHTMAPR